MSTGDWIFVAVLASAATLFIGLALGDRHTRSQMERRQREREEHDAAFQDRLKLARLLGCTEAHGQQLNKIEQLLGCGIQHERELLEIDTARIIERLDDVLDRLSKAGRPHE